MEIITQRTAAEMMKKSGGKLFRVVFIKRSTGSHRRMVARVGVSKGVTGEGKKFNPKDHDLVTVHEFVSDRDERGRMSSVGTQFRHVPIEGILSLRMGGKEFQIQGY